MHAKRFGAGPPPPAGRKGEMGYWQGDAGGSRPPAPGPRPDGPRLRQAAGRADDGAAGADVPVALSRQFRAAYGETPYSYLMTRRIERAMALLRRGDLSVTDVCMEVGCTSLGSFAPGSPRSWGRPRAATGPGATTRPPWSRRAWPRTGPDRAGSRSAGQRTCVASSVWKSRSHTASSPSTTRTRPDLLPRRPRARGQPDRRSAPTAG